MVYDGIERSAYYNEINAMRANIVQWENQLKEEEAKLQECADEIRKKLDDADLAIVVLTGLP